MNERELRGALPSAYRRYAVSLPKDVVMLSDPKTETFVLVGSNRVVLAEVAWRVASAWKRPQRVMAYVARRALRGTA